MNLVFVATIARSYSSCTAPPPPWPLAVVFTVHSELAKWCNAPVGMAVVSNNSYAKAMSPAPLRQSCDSVKISTAAESSMENTSEKSPVMVDGTGYRIG